MLARKIEQTRKYVKNPECVDVQIEKLKNNMDNQLSDIECHGMQFMTKDKVVENDILCITFKVDEMLFSGKAKVCKVVKSNSGYEVYVDFLQCVDPFQIKMALQVCQIKEFLESKCKHMDQEDAALRWIKMNAANF